MEQKVRAYGKVVRTHGIRNKTCEGIGNNRKRDLKLE